MMYLHALGLAIVASFFVVLPMEIVSQPLEITPQKHIRATGSSGGFIFMKRMASGKVYVTNINSGWFILNEKHSRLEKLNSIHVLQSSKVVDFWKRDKKYYFLENTGTNRYAFSIMEDSLVLRKKIQPLPGAKSFIPMSFVVTDDDEIVLTATQFDENGYYFHKFDSKFEYQSSFAPVIKLSGDISISGRFYYVHSVWQKQHGFVLTYPCLPILEIYKPGTLARQQILLQEIQPGWFAVDGDSSFHIDPEMKAYSIMGTPSFSEQGMLWIPAITKHDTETYTDLWVMIDNKFYNKLRIMDFEVKKIIISQDHLKLFALTKNEILYFDLAESGKEMLKYMKE